MYMNILLVHNHYQSPGGEDSVYENEIELLSQNGHQVIRYEKSNDEIAGIFGKIKAATALIWSFSAQKEVKEIIKKNDIDIVHCHNLFPLISPSVYTAAKSLHVPVIQTVHNFRMICPNALCLRNNKICDECIEKNLFYAVKHRCYRNSRFYSAAQVVAMKCHRRLKVYEDINMIFLTDHNRRMFSSFTEKYGANSYVKCNFVPNMMPRPPKTNLPERYIAYVGRLSEEKGFSNLISLWNESSAKEGLTLVIAGDGDLRDSMDRFADDVHVRYIGWQTANECRFVISQAEAIIFPSICHEGGAPLAIGEAFSCGTPVVSESVGNHGHMIQASGAGECFSGNNADSFDTALKAVLNNRDFYSKNALSYYSEHLSPEKSYSELLSIYESSLRLLETYEN